jgi:alkanesulfonate monooxygenase SsuD/methylene tetrahydromethanopterin reductase-like flavin-dependent oxidoreductase (luciferase family)
MRQGLALPTGGGCGDPRLLMELAELAEASGWDGVFLEDYVLYQGDRRAPTCDTWVALAAMAVRTERVRLGVEVAPLARRRPWNVARQAAGVDQLSGGRMVLGVGIGDVGNDIGIDASFTAFGEEVDARRRGDMLDEALDVIAGLWTGEPFSYRGRHFQVDDVTFLPRPLQQPRIPIWVGGGYPNRRPTERALRWGGSCLYRETHGGDWQDMGPDEVRALRAAAGRRPLEIAVGGRRRGEDWERDRELMRAVAEAGADWWCEWLAPAPAHELRAAVARGPLLASGASSR